MPRLRLLDSRNLSHGEELAGQAKERNEFNPLCSIDSRMRKDPSVASKPIPSLETLLIGMTRQTWIFFKAISWGFYFSFSFSLGNGFAMDFNNSKTFNPLSF